MKQAGRILAVVLVLVSAWMAYDNVLSDDASIRDLAEKAACGVKKCDLPHGLVRGSRTPIGQSYEYAWSDGTVAVWCHRELYAAGARTCAPE